MYAQIQSQEGKNLTELPQGDWEHWIYIEDTTTSLSKKRLEKATVIPVYKEAV